MAAFRTNSGRIRVLVPESRSGLIIGDFEDQRFPLTTLASRDAIAKTPPPPEGLQLSGMDNGRVSRFRARSGLRWQVTTTGFRRHVRERFQANLETPTQNRDQG